MRHSFWRWNLLQSSRLALPSSGARAALVKKKKGALVRKRVKVSFDPKNFLAKVGEGKTIAKYRKDQIVFSQGEVADAVFYSRILCFHPPFAPATSIGKIASL